jgi:hypothetical protein
MAQVNCKYCGATVNIARVFGTDDFVPLETTPDPSSEAPLYRIITTESGRLVVERVSDYSGGNYLPDHRFDCPGFQ